MKRDLPPNKIHTAWRMPRELFAAIKKQAKSLGVTYTEMVCDILARELGLAGKPNPEPCPPKPIRFVDPPPPPPEAPFAPGATVQCSGRVWLIESVAEAPRSDGRWDVTLVHERGPNLLRIQVDDSIIKKEGEP